MLMPKTVEKLEDLIDKAKSLKHALTEEAMDLRPVDKRDIRAAVVGSLRSLEKVFG